MELEQNGSEYDTAGCSVAVGGGSAIMSRSAWSRGARCGRAPLCSEDTASQCCPLEDQLESVKENSVSAIIKIIQPIVNLPYYFTMAR